MRLHTPRVRPVTRARLVVLLLALAIFASSPAGAFTPQESQVSGYKHISLWGCSWEQTWINNWQASPRLQSLATFDNTTDQWCGDTRATLPPGSIAVKQDLIAWTPARGEFLCNEGLWWLNGTQSHEVWTGFNFQRPCGASWYKGHGHAGILRGGYWLGPERPPNPTGWISL